MNFVNNEIIQLEDKIFSKFDETLELMKAYEAKRLQFAKNLGMPEQIFTDIQSRNKARYSEIVEHLKLEYFLRFHHELYYESPTCVAVIPTATATNFNEDRRQFNLDNFGEHFLSSEVYVTQMPTQSKPG